MSWRNQAIAAIMSAHASLPVDCSLKQRAAAIDAAYPFGVRQFHPYKIWLAVRREYLCKHGYKGKGPAAQLSPLERMMRKANGGAA